MKNEAIADNTRLSLVDNNNPLWGDEWVALREMWALDYSIFQFSHGAYGACPRVVHQKQMALLEHIQKNPTGFYRRELLPLLEAARLRAAEYCGADPSNLAWVRNATDGMTAAINALVLGPSDELVITNHIYESVRVAVQRCSRQTGVQVVEAKVPITDNDDELVAAIEIKLSSRTKALVIDEIASPTGRIFPVSRIAEITRSRKIPLIVDAAHAPGMAILDVENKGADIWVGNFHKWVCAPHVAGVLWARPEWHEKLVPLSASFRDELPFPQNFGRLGTDDLTPAILVPSAIDFLDELGAQKVRSYSCDLAKYGARVISEALKTELVPGKFAARTPIALPKGVAHTEAIAYGMQAQIAKELRAELSVAGPLTEEPHGYILISAFAYNHPDEYHLFAERLVAWLKANHK